MFANSIKKGFCVYAHAKMIPDGNVLCKLLVPTQATPFYNQTPILVCSVMATHVCVIMKLGYL